MVSETITFTNLSTGSAPLSYAWDLDDDGLVDSTATDAAWQYRLTGTITVTLNTTNAYGCSDMHSAPVSVLSPDDFYSVFLPVILKE
jgi:PKD repeat protein